MRSPLLSPRIFTLLVACASLMWGSAAAPAFASEATQDPPPPVYPVVANDEVVFPDPMTVPLGELMGLEPGAGDPSNLDQEPATGGQIQRLSMPATTLNVDGLSSPTHSTNNPPHVDGAVSPAHYLQVVQGHLGIFSKSDGALLGHESFETLWNAITQSNICLTTPSTTNYHRGDPAVLYDQLNDHWIITDVAVEDYASGPFALCVAVSQSANPLGSWTRWYVEVDDPWLPDTPEVGIWPEGLYVAADMYDCTGSSTTACETPTYMGARAWAIKLVKLYEGPGLNPEDIQYATLGTGYQDLLPGSLLGVAPPAGTPNYLASKDLATANLDIWAFDVDWTTPANSTFTGPAQVAIAAYTAPPALIPENTGENLDSQGDRLMARNVYRKIGAVESVWLAHTVGDGGTPNRAGIRWYQLDVTGGAIDAAPAQYGTFFGGPPADGVYRWIPSLAVDTDGNMAVGYSASSASIFPEIRYAGRLFSDTLGTLAQGETTLHAGTGAQVGGGGTWGPHSSMSVDPSDDCTFWYTDMYYDAADTGTANWTTRIAAFKFAGCAIDIIDISGNAGIAGAVLHYDNPGPLTATADGSGNYSFLVPSSWSGTVTPVLPHYFFDPPYREYSGILAHQTDQDYTPYPFVEFAPDNGATVCRMPYIIVKIFLSDLTRNTNGTFKSSAVTFKLDGGNILNLSTIRVPQTSPNAWAYIMYRPSANLATGSHTAVFTHPEVSGTVTDTWTFTAANIACGEPMLLSALVDEQTVELQAAPDPLLTSDASRQVLIAPIDASAGGSTTDSQQQPPAPTESDSASRRERDPERPEASPAGPLAAAPGSAQSLQPAQQLIAPAFPANEFAWSGWTMEPGRPILIYLKPR